MTTPCRQLTVARTPVARVAGGAARPVWRVRRKRPGRTPRIAVLRPCVRARRSPMPNQDRAVSVYPIAVRELSVSRIVDVTPALRRVTLTGDQLGAFTDDEGRAWPAFTSTGFDDDVRLIFPYPGRPNPSCRSCATAASSCPRGAGRSGGSTRSAATTPSPVSSTWSSCDTASASRPPGPTARRRGTGSTWRTGGVARAAGHGRTAAGRRGRHRAARRLAAAGDRAGGPAGGRVHRGRGDGTPGPARRAPGVEVTWLVGTVPGRVRRPSWPSACAR